MKILLLTVLTAATFVPVALGQPTTPGQTVRGAVVDSTGLPLPGATVLLSTRSDGALAAFATTNLDGAFRLPPVTPDNYELRVSFIGFETLVRDVEVAAELVDLGPLTLRPRVSELGQLEVTGRRVPVVARGDTLDYHVAAFDVRAGSSVEALLGEMPGIEVDSDGTVRAQGRVVDRVTVDGRDFFGNVPSVATRNLPADAVSRVQVFDERPDGEASGGRRTLNLELREDRRQSVFGRAEGGGGADVADPASVRYVGRASANRFGPSLRLSAIGSVNNVNEPGLTGREYLGLVGTGDAQPGEIIRVDSPILVDADAVQGWASSWTGGANLTYEAAPGTTLQANYVGYAARTVTASETVRERPSAGAGTVLESETDAGASAGWVHRAEARADRVFGEGHSLRVVTTLDVQGGDGDSDVERQAESGVADAARSYRTASSRENARLGATYVRPLSERWQARAEVDATVGSRHEDARSDGPDPSLPVGAPVHGTARGITARAAITRSLGGFRSVEVRAGYAFDVETQTLGDGAEGVLGPHSYRRPYSATSVGTVLSGGTPALRASVGADLSLVQRHDLLAGSEVYVLPTASLSYTVAQNQTVRLRYSARVDPTPGFKLHAVPTLLSPFRVHVGNPDLRDVTSHTATAQYLDVDTFNGSSLFVYASARYGHDAHAYSRVVDDAGVTTITPVNAEDALTLSGSASYERSVQAVGLSVRADLSGSHMSAQEVVNGRQSAYQATLGSADVRLQKRGGVLRHSHVGLRSSVQSLAYGSGVGLSQTSAVLNPYARLSITTGWGAFRASLGQEVRVGSLGYPARAPRADVEVSLPPVRGVSASVTASDLLNGGVLIEEELAPGVIEVNRYETLGRRLTFRLTTTF